jgi:O-antigen/teichoic acid export membrane protein
MIMNASTFFLSLFASTAQVGYFGAAERLATLGLSLMQPANQVLVGTVARRLATRGSETHAYGLMRKALWFMGAFGVAGCVGALVLAPHLIPLILGPRFEPSVRIMLVLAFIYPFAAFNQVVCMYVLIPLNEDKLLATATLAGAACSLTAMLLLAGGFGGVGVAAARVLGEAVTAGTLIVILARRQGLLRLLFPARVTDALSRLKRRPGATLVPEQRGEQ